MSDLPPPPGTEEPAEGPFDQGYGPMGAPSYGYAQGSSPVYVLASFWRRFGAYLIDSVLLAVPINLLALIAGSDQLGFGTTGETSGFDPLVTIFSIVGGVAYYAILEGGPKGQTVGKLALGLRVVDAETGQPGIGIGRGIGRYFARILSSLPLYLGYLWMLWDARKQTWHDKLVRTVIVRSDVSAPPAWPS